MSYALEVDNITVQYGQTAILKNISFTVQQGEIIGILGPNGSGKTTLLKAILGLVNLHQGNIKILGKNISDLTPKNRAKLAGMVPQKTETPFPFSVYEITLMGRYPHISYWEGYGEKDRAITSKALKDIGISNLANRFFSQLSGGEQQLSLLARLRAQDPSIFFLDEATSALDIKRKIESLDFICNFSKYKQKTLLTVFHDINLAALYCKRLLLIKNGSIKYDGPTSEILTPQKIMDIFETEVIITKHPLTGAPQVFFKPSLT